MKNLILALIVAIGLFSCQKLDAPRELPGDASKTEQVSLIDESDVLKPSGGYSTGKRADDFIASQQRGKPVKNDVSNITSLMTTVVSAYQINLNWYGVKGAVSYNIYRDDVLIVNTKQPYYNNYGLSPNTKYKYRVAGVASNGTVGNLSNIAYGTTHSTDIGSTVILYMSFNGDTTTSGNWTPYSGGQPLITAPSGFTEDEKQLIADSVAKDLSQFTNIKVTRSKAEYDAADKARRHKTIFTASYEWYSGPTPTAGGVAYINSWTWSDGSPAFVFSLLLSYSSHNIAEAIAHEAGHTLGLRHQSDCENGVVVNQYSFGKTMGVSYGVFPIGVWWNGTNSFCVNQDDKAKLETVLGKKQIFAVHAFNLRHIHSF